LWAASGWVQHCSLCSGLLWLFKVFCTSIWTLGIIFVSPW
jgi:hypothetical protein